MTGGARAFWVREPGCGEIRTAAVPPAGPGEVLVRTLYSAVSRGTESVVFTGRSRPGCGSVMRAPFQEGDFPGPVKYGYLNVGVVERGPERPGRTDGVLPLPAPDPVRGARLGRRPGTGRGPGGPCRARRRDGDRGQRAVGRPATRRRPHRRRRRGARRVLRGRRHGQDSGGAGPAPRPRRLAAPVAAALGVDFALPAEATGDCDLVVHASATSSGLATSLELAGAGGDRAGVELVRRSARARCRSARSSTRAGSSLRSSQVGSVAPARRGRRSPADRLALALELLADPALDTLITGESDFAELPEVLPRLVGGDLPAICHRIRYPDQDDRTTTDDEHEED